MRIALGQIWQETNTFNPLRTTRRDFEAFGVSRGEEMLQRMAGTNELGGFIQSLRKWPENPELVGLVRLPAWPAGMATVETFDWIKQEVVSALKVAMPVDAVLLALHGSMSAEDHPDVEGEILAAVREVIGSKIPLVSTLDLHANITPRMVSSADALVLYHSIPHVDIYETGIRGAAVLRRILVDGARPTTAFVKVPAVFPAEKANSELATGMSAEFKRKVQAWEARPDVLAAGLATVQPWLDIPEFGSSVMITTDNDPALATSLCSELASELWARREEYLPELLSAEEGVQQALEHLEGLTVLSDAADATTSGAPGDSVWILRELVKHDWPRPTLCTVVSPEVVQQAESLGVGAENVFSLGGVRDHRFGTRIEFPAKVERLFDARFTLSGHIGKNLPIHMGRCAVLRRKNVVMVVTSRSGPHFAPELFQAAGYDPFAASVLVAKSPCGFRAAYAARAARIFSIRAPGCAPSDFWNYEYRNIQRPLWPWDEIPDWQPRPGIFPSERP
jgi:microcystin degradation protein MlrC